MKLGVYGGTFSPPHVGHLIVATAVREQLGLERVLFVPGAVPPHKTGQEILDGSHRLAMLRLAVEGDEGLGVSDIELRRGGVSYTVETLEELARRHAGAELHLLIGMDNYTEFDTWREPGEILRLARLVVMTRPGYTKRGAPELPAERVIFCDVPEIEIASRQIRKRVREGKPIRYLVPPAVERYVLEHRLYAG